MRWNSDNFANGGFCGTKLSCVGELMGVYMEKKMVSDEKTNSEVVTCCLFDMIYNLGIRGV
jgi:hypothetical protein